MRKAPKSCTCRSAQSVNPMSEFVIPSWVPRAAANVIEWHSTLPGVTARDIALLERLATADAMRAVWPKLTSVDAGEIVRIVLIAEAAARDIRRPLPKTSNAMAAYLKDLGETPLFPSRPGGVASFCEQAAKNMRDHEVNARLLWPDLWPGQPDMTFDRLLLQLNAAAQFYRSLEAAY